VEQKKFFTWTSRINSILFLILLILSIGFVIYGILESKKWGQRNVVEVIDKKSADKAIEDLRLSNISKVCGKDIHFVKLKSAPKSKEFSSGGYSNITRNIVFFAGSEMKSHWLFDTDKYLINEIDQLKKNADDCKDKETKSIYYEIVKSDTDKNGKLDDNDAITIALTSADGLNYFEIDSGLSSVIDHSIVAKLQC